MIKNKGFTIIEFMIVIAIIGIIAAVAIPAFSVNHHALGSCYNGYLMTPAGTQMVDTAGQVITCN